MNSEDVIANEDRQTGYRKWALVGLVAIVAGGGGIWLGGQGPEPQWPEDKAKAEAIVLPAQDPQAAKPVVDENLVRGVINPSSESTIASKMTARIIAMPYGEGQSFPAGALLARFDCSQISAELNAARAATAAYRKTYDTNVELDL